MASQTQWFVRGGWGCWLPSCQVRVVRFYVSSRPPPPPPPSSSSASDGSVAGPQPQVQDGSVPHWTSNTSSAWQCKVCTLHGVLATVAITRSRVVFEKVKPLHLAHGNQGLAPECVANGSRLTLGVWGALFARGSRTRRRCHWGKLLERVLDGSVTCQTRVK